MSFSLKIQTESLQLLLDIFDNKLVDNQLDSYLKHRQMKPIFKLYRKFFNIGNRKVYRNTLLNLIKYNSKEKDQFFLYEIPNKINEIRDKLQSMHLNIESVKKQVFDRVVSYTDGVDFSNIRLILYWGSTEKGTSPYPGIIYLNLRHFLNDDAGLVEILSHELYHARKRDYTKYLKFYTGCIISKRKSYIRLLGGLFEEGIAGLIEHNNLKAKSYEELKCSNTMLAAYQAEFSQLLKDYSLNEKSNISFADYNANYVLGYEIASVIYDFSGIEGLNVWTKDYDYIKYLELYKKAKEEK